MAASKEAHRARIIIRDYLFKIIITELSYCPKYIYILGAEGMMDEARKRLVLSACPCLDVQVDPRSMRAEAQTRAARSVNAASHEASGYLARRESSSRSTTQTGSTTSAPVARMRPIWRTSVRPN